MDQIHLSPLVDQIQLTLGHISNSSSLQVLIICRTYVNKAEEEVMTSITTKAEHKVAGTTRGSSMVLPVGLEAVRHSFCTWVAP
jgi:hypothetical protein